MNSVIIIYCISAVCMFATPENVTSANISQHVSESGAIISPNDTTHMGREHMIKLNLTLPSSVPAFVVPDKNDDKKSVPRKGVTFTNTTTSSTTTIKPKKRKKPTITEASDDDPFAPSNFDTTTVKKNQTKSHHQQLAIIDDVLTKKKTDYIVPIVAVIMSVPLVAILISVLYKRSSEWWQHRHYRRMDFLIEGMYNN